MELDEQILQVLGSAGRIYQHACLQLECAKEHIAVAAECGLRSSHPEVVAEFKRMAEKDALETLHRYNAWLAVRDADNPDAPLRRGAVFKTCRPGYVNDFEENTELETDCLREFGGSTVVKEV